MLAQLQFKIVLSISTYHKCFSREKNQYWREGHFHWQSLKIAAVKSSSFTVCEQWHTTVINPIQMPKRWGGSGEGFEYGEKLPRLLCTFQVAKGCIGILGLQWQHESAMMKNKKKWWAQCTIRDPWNLSKEISSSLKKNTGYLLTKGDMYGWYCAKWCAILIFVCYCSWYTLPFTAFWPQFSCFHRPLITYCFLVGTFAFANVCDFLLPSWKSGIFI